MKMAEAMAIIEDSEKGFMVHFTKDGGTADYFPDKHEGEELIKDEDEAWALAGKFAKATGPEIYDIYVVSQDHRPVAHYNEKRLKAGSL